MDPDAALWNVVEAALESDQDSLLEAAEDLAEWLRKGGVAPSGSVLAERLGRRCRL